MTTEPRGAERLVEALVGLDVDVVFGLPGVHNLALWDAIAGSGIRMIGVRHEQAAAYAADGYARATGKLGVAMVTTGPGAANTVAAAGEAWTVGSPIMVIATDISTAERRPGVFRGALHECRDQQAMFAPVTKFGLTATDPDTLGTDVRIAAAQALTAPSGPVYLGIPIDVLYGPAPSALTPLDPPPAIAPVAAAELATAASAINAATSPVLWVGGGAVSSGAGDEIVALADALGSPVLTTYGARGIIPPDHPCAIAAPVQVEEVEAVWDDADVVIAIGTDFDGMMTRAWAMKQPEHLIVINVDAVDGSKNYPADQVLEGDARTILQQLVPLVEETGRSAETATRLDAIEASVWDTAREESPESIRLLEVLEDVVPHEGVIVVDMCVAGYWIGGMHRIPRARKLAYPVGWGTLGFAFPASIGTAASGVGPTVVISGDGGFLYACGELATVAQEELPITTVIVDDGGYGMLKFAQVHNGEPTRGVDLHTPDFIALAESFGVPTVETSPFGDDFAEALRAGIARGRPNVIVVKTALLPPPNTSVRSARKPIPVT